MKKKILLLASLTLLFFGCAKENDALGGVRYNNVSISESRITAGAIDVFIEAKNENADIYYLFVSDGAKAPSENEIKEGKDYGDVHVLSYGSGKGMVYKTVDGFDELTWIDFYCVLQEGNEMSMIYSTSIMTLDEKGVEYKGEGTIENPYLVSTIEDLEQVASDSTTLSAYYELQNDLDLSEVYGEGKKSFIPLGSQSGSVKAFNGQFNGNGHTISNLYIDSKAEQTGLFGQLGMDGVIANLTIKDANITSTQQRTGAVVGYSKGTVSNINVIHSTVKGTRKVGAAVGDFYEYGYCGKVLAYDCDIYGSGQDDVGGLIGAVDVSGGMTNPIQIENCYVIKTKVEGLKATGGLIGYARGMEINKCYANATIKGSENVGGLLGHAEDRDGSPISPSVSNSFAYNCKVTGSINGSYLFGNKSAKNDGVATKNLYYSGVTVDAPKLKDSTFASEIPTWFTTTEAASTWFKNKENIEFDFDYSWEFQEDAIRPTLINAKQYDDGKAITWSN